MKSRTDMMTPRPLETAWTRTIPWCLALLAATIAMPAFAQEIKVGEAAYFLKPKGSEKTPPAAALRTEALMSRAAPTNQWYSTLVFDPKPQVIYAQPLTVKASTTGFEVALPSKKIVQTERHDVEVHYPHEQPIVINPTAFPLGAAKLAKADDWSIDIAMAHAADQLLATVTHGSPYVYFRVSRGGVRVALPSTATRVPLEGQPHQLVVDVQGKRYGVFGPTGALWKQAPGGAWIGEFPEGKGYFSLAALPDSSPETLSTFAQHAYAFVDTTRVEWAYDQARSTVQTTFSATTTPMEGSETVPILGLYPHHWNESKELQGRLGPAFETLRGPIKTLAANHFTTTQRYLGWVPFWPGVQATTGANDLKDVMGADVRNARRMMLQGGDGPYWQGKGLLRTIKLMDVLEQQGDLAARDRLLELVKGRMEEWFSGKSGKTYFQYDANLGTMLAHPEEYFSIEQLNDHYFHYGYWIRAAAEIALRDPAWAAPQRWGGIVNELVADIANSKRGEKRYPFLRHFDPYEGHSWASGVGLGEYGNNQESSSEAANAWAALILWGEVQNDKALRDLGVYMYTTEVQAIDYYWFDAHRLVFPPEYKNVETAMLFGGKYAHNTWWTDEPRQIKGINLLPMTTASTYLGRDPAYVRKNMQALPAEVALYEKYGKRPSNPPPKDIWQDIFAKYQALDDPRQALANWNRWGSVEIGDSRSHTLHWMLSLEALGQPDFSVTADTPLHAAFLRSDGSRTYMAYNASTSPIQVKFSDGKTLSVNPRTLGVAK